MGSFGPMGGEIVSRPIIGVTLDHNRERKRYELNYNAVRAIALAGGEPVLLPFYDGAPFPEFVSGLLLTGGNDPDPAAWGEAWHPACNRVDPNRERHERFLALEAERRNLPVFGICFGMQVMNLVRGGSLIQHLGDDPKWDDHTRGGTDFLRKHRLDIDPDSVAARIVGGTSIEINTNHHQAIGRVGNGLRAVGHAPDGTVELIEDASRRFWIGAQWHPEHMLDEPKQLALFEGLIAAAAEGRRGETV